MNKLIINQEVTTEDTHNPGKEAHRWREAWGHHQAAARTIDCIFVFTVHYVQYYFSHYVQYNYRL
jgi:hypothetical protein